MAGDESRWCSFQSTWRAKPDWFDTEKEPVFSGFDSNEVISTKH
jgi:hypothetical protein